MSASDDYLCGRRDAIDEILHLMGDYAMAGIGDRELRQELKRMRDEASRTLTARLKRTRREPLIIEQVLEEEYWRSQDITDAMEEQLAELSKDDPRDPAVEVRRDRIERILGNQASTREIITRGLGRTPSER